MSEISVHSGGQVEVDTRTLRLVSDRLRELRDNTDRASLELQIALNEVSLVPAGTAPAGQDALTYTRELRDRVSEQADRLAKAADRYELAEVERAMSLNSDDAALRQRWVELLQRNPDRSPATYVLGHVFGSDRFQPARDRLAQPGAGIIGAQIVSQLGKDGHGVRTGSRTWLHNVISFRKAEMTMEEISPGTDAPTGYEDLMFRIPSEGPQIRIDKLTQPDGTQTFITYVGGTREQGLWGSDPLSNGANYAMYSQNSSPPSYEAVALALKRAGAEKGDTVIPVGYSQGGMIAEFVAAEDRYNVPMMLSFGSPLEVEAPSGTQHIAVRHNDDVVAALTGGGLPGRNGASTSAVVERLTSEDPSSGGLLDPHARAQYLKTARQMDGSFDVRLQAGVEQLDRFREGSEVTTYEYTFTEKWR